MRLADEIKKAVELEIKGSPNQEEYFEAVFAAKDLDRLSAILRNNVGEVLKAPGKKARFSKDEKKLINLIGGIWEDQALYLKTEAGGSYTYAALWPWQSDPSRITLKIGKGRFPLP